MLKIPKGYRRLDNLEMIILNDKLYSSATKRFSKVSKNNTYALYNKAERFICVIRRQNNAT